MTYDVQRWAVGYTAKIVKHTDGRYVLAAEAEAHERAAIFDLHHGYYKQVREQAIRDCCQRIAAYRDGLDSFTRELVTDLLDTAISELQALLTEGSEK